MSGQFLVQYMVRRAINKAMKIAQHMPNFNGNTVEAEDSYKTRQNGVCMVKVVYDGYNMASFFYINGVESSVASLETAIDTHIASL